MPIGKCHCDDCAMYADREKGSIGVSMPVFNLRDGGRLEFILLWWYLLDLEASYDIDIRLFGCLNRKFIDRIKDPSTRCWTFLPSPLLCWLSVNMVSSRCLSVFLALSCALPAVLGDVVQKPDLALPKDAQMHRDDVEKLFVTSYQAYKFVMFGENYVYWSIISFSGNLRLVMMTCPPRASRLPMVVMDGAHPSWTRWTLWSVILSQLSSN